MSSRTKRQRSSDAYRLLYASCPDQECQAKLYFPSYDKSVECTECGQRHDRSLLKNIAEVTNPDVALHNILLNYIQGKVKPKKGADNVKVLGLSNYVCKLISPILTYYGMDKETGQAKLLCEMGKGEMFDVSILGDRAFLLDEEHLDVIGYGRDRSGSLLYLADTLKDITAFNDEECRLVPIHADGDGHCLVHAVSRALVGRELFWHALRVNLKKHMTDNLGKYKDLLKDFIDQDEWPLIISECDPYYVPPEGEALGLRNIHIFGLANVLHRPIILLDSKEGMSSSGDYSGVFLPGLVAPEKCRGKDGTLNKPLCIAWSSCGRNHYIPLVGIKGKGLPLLPTYMVQKAWGMSREAIKDYIQFDNMYRCSVGGDKCLTDRYLRQLVSTMEAVYTQKYDVNPGLVADVHQYIYKSSGIVGVHPDEVLERTQNAVANKLLYRCLTCEALVEYLLSKELFKHGGSLYNLAVSIYKKLDPNKLYSFPAQGAVCSYDETQDCLVPDMDKSKPKTCVFCAGTNLRHVRADGSIEYIDGDRTTTRCVGTKCPCGYKHFWKGKEYDNIPEIVPISLQWGGKTIAEEIAWFQFESDPTMNSNVFEVAQAVVQKHFPGEFGSERLVQRVVDTILDQTARANRDREREDKGATFDNTVDNPWSAETASKIILTGQKKKTLHKEELMKSEKEKAVRLNVQANAPKVQMKKTAQLEHQKSGPVSQRPLQQPPACRDEMPASCSTTSVMSTPAVMSVTTSPAKQQPAPATKKIRLATSDGRQEMLNLDQDVTYTQLQSLICQVVNVPADRQKIRVGFPPKVLEMEIVEGEETTVKLSHGDKVSLEILPDRTPLSQDCIHVTPSHPAPSSSQGSWSSFEEAAHTQTAETLLQALKEAPHSGDSIDTSIASLGILSAVAGKDMWTYVQGMPHLFSVGGLLYQQVKRDLGLTDGKHCQLPCLPGKVFRYNGKEDRLELCLEPYGHFPVEPHIEQKVRARGLGGSAEDEAVKFGSSGAVHHGHERRAFSGQGHSLVSTDDRMPIDLACASHKPQVRGFRDLCSPPGTNQASILEEPENMQVEEQGDQSGPKYQRLGPGYSVLDQSATNTDNSNIEMFRALAESIEKTLSEDIEETGSLTGSQPTQNKMGEVSPGAEDADPSSSITEEPMVCDVREAADGDVAEEEMHVEPAPGQDADKDAAECTAEETEPEGDSETVGMEQKMCVETVADKKTEGDSARHQGMSGDVEEIGGPGKEGGQAEVSEGGVGQEVGYIETGQQGHSTVISELQTNQQDVPEDIADNG